MYRSKTLTSRIHKISVLEMAILLTLILGIALLLFRSIFYNTHYALVPAYHFSNNGGFGIASTDTNQNCDVTVTDADYQRANDFLTKVNAYRSSKGSGPLKLSPTLMKSAKWQSTDMNTHHVLNHTDSLGRDPFHRMEDCGYSNTANMGENVAQGQTSTSSVLTAWQGDAGHDFNLLNPDSIVMGIAYVGDMWTMDTGSIDDTQNSGDVTTTPTPTNTQTTTPTPGSSPIVTASPTNPPINALTMQITAHFPGIGKSGNISPNHPTKSVAFSLYDTNNAQIASWQTPLTYTGDAYTALVYAPPTVQPGRYMLKAKADGVLTHIVQPVFINLQIGKTITLPPFTFVEGDIDNNNTVDHKDFSLLVACIKDQKCSSTKTEDFNDDGRINLSDYNLLLRSFSDIRGE